MSRELHACIGSDILLRWGVVVSPAAETRRITEDWRYDAYQRLYLAILLCIGPLPRGKSSILRLSIL